MELAARKVETTIHLLQGLNIIDCLICSLVVRGMTIKPLLRKVQPRSTSRYHKLPVIGPNLNSLLAWLRGRGYSESTIRNHLVRFARLCRWLQRRCGRALSGLSQGDLRTAYRHFQKKHRIEVACVSRVLGLFLAEQHLLLPEVEKPPSHGERLLRSFGAYLRDMRGLAPSTVLGNSRRISTFLQFLKVDERPSVLRRLNRDQIDAFLCQAAKTNNRFSLQHVVASLRTFLRKLHAEGVLRKPLHQQIDTPRTYRLEQLPRALPWEQIVALLRSIDCSVSGGLRDFTVLYLAASYGLRSSEVVHLTLDDIDWRGGALRIRQTKTKQTLLLPLSEESRAVFSALREGGSSKQRTPGTFSSP